MVIWRNETMAIGMSTPTTTAGSEHSTRGSRRATGSRRALICPRWRRPVLASMANRLRRGATEPPWLCANSRVPVRGWNWGPSSVCRCRSAESRVEPWSQRLAASRHGPAMSSGPLLPRASMVSRMVPPAASTTAQRSRASGMQPGFGSRLAAPGWRTGSCDCPIEESARFSLGAWRPDSGHPLDRRPRRDGGVGMMAAAATIIRAIARSTTGIIGALVS